MKLKLEKTDEILARIWALWVQKHLFKRIKISKKKLRNFLKN